jgi:hypothetical protein
MTDHELSGLPSSIRMSSNLGYCGAKASAVRRDSSGKLSAFPYTGTTTDTDGEDIVDRFSKAERAGWRSKGFIHP